MPMPMTVRISGGPETALVLRNLPKRSASGRVLSQALRPGARLIANAARRNLRSFGAYDTGQTARSIAIGVKRQAAHRARLVVGHRGQRARVSHLIEFGFMHRGGTRIGPRPYMRSAAQQHIREALRMFGFEIWARISREATRLAVRGSVRKGRR